jgi:hypothetical protein
VDVKFGLSQYGKTMPSQIFRPKAKAVPLHATKVLGGEEVQLLLILDLGSRWS